jgi:hypothetical protein
MVDRNTNRLTAHGGSMESVPYWQCFPIIQRTGSAIRVAATLFSASASEGCFQSALSLIYLVTRIQMDSLLQRLALCHGPIATDNPVAWHQGTADLLEPS